MLKSFQTLKVYQKARALTKDIYQVSLKFPHHEMYGITSQIRRASVSVCCNISEGTGKSSKKDQIRFIEIAYSSLMEVLNLILLASDLTYVTKENSKDLDDQITEIAKMLSGLRSKYSSCQL